MPNGIDDSSSTSTSLHQRLSLLSMDNANLRSMLESRNAELASLKKRLSELDSSNDRQAASDRQAAAVEKENKALKQTLKYLQAELVKAGKKVH